MEKERKFKCFRMERQMLPSGIVGDVLVEDHSSDEGEKVQVPLLDIPMMDDEEWNRKAKENAVRNYIMETGHKPPSEEMAVKWQRKRIEKILKS